MFHESNVVAPYPSVTSPQRRHISGHGDDRRPPLELLAALWRRRAWIAGGALLGLVAAIAFLALVTPRHTAIVQLLIDPNDLRVSDNAMTTSSTPSDANVAQVESQVRVLTSDKVLRQVIAAHGLDVEPEFSAATSGLGTSFDALAERVGITQSVVQKDPAVVALHNLATAIVARRQERTYVVDLSVTTREPEKSALIANAIIKAYLAELDAARTDAARRATDALSSRLQELRDRLRDAEDRNERYKAENNIVATSGQLINEQQLTDLSNQLTLASVRAEEAKARLGQIERLRKNRADPAGISEAVQSPTLAALRAQYAEVQHREAELTGQLGARHPSIVDIKAQARDLRQVIDRELGRLSEAARGDYDRALAAQDGLERRLATLRGEAVRLCALEREVEASRAVYQAFLARETSERERFGTVNVQVLSEANQRAKKAWPPPAIVVLAAAFAFGAAAGAGLGVLRDWSDDRIRSRRDLEAVCQLPVLAEIPGISEDRNTKGRWARMLAKARAHRQGIALMAPLLDAPKSRFAAGIHRLADALRSTGPNGAPRVTTFIAAGEPGARSDVALNLALASASNPKRVLLVDADLTRRELSSRVVGSNGDGLLDVAEQRVDLDGALIAEPHSGLMVLQAGHPPASGDQPIDPDLVVNMLDRVRGTYSVIVDGPSDRCDPLAPALAAASDATVLVVTADLTRARDLAELQRSADLAGGKLRGVVFVSRPGENA